MPSRDPQTPGGEQTPREFDSSRQPAARRDADLPLESVPHSSAESLGEAQAAAHVGFVLTGIVNTLLGPILPIVSQRWSLTDAQAGRLFAAQFLAALLGTLASGRAMAALGVRRCAMFGLALMALGVTATGFAGPAMGALAVACYGLGLGFCVPATNLWIARADSHRSASALNSLNASWCIGAASCAPLVLFCAERFGLTKTLGTIGILLAITSVFGAIPGSRGGRGGSEARRDAGLKPGAAYALAPDRIGAASSAAAPIAAAPIAAARSTQPVSAAPVAGLPRLAASSHFAFVSLICAFMFFYVGVEAGVGGWAATYAQRLHLLSAAKIGFAQSTFYGALLLGRVIAPLGLRRMSATRLLLCGLLIGAAGALLFTIAPITPAVVLGGICIAGIGLAPIFPVVVSIYSDELGVATTRSAGLVFGLANLGGATFPWLIGRVSTTLNGLRYGMLVPLACIAIMLLIAKRSNALLRRAG